MELRQLQYFTTIARLGGFRKAADELSVSQATLSEQIKFLEQELGVRLLERGGRAVTLTEAGLALRDRADRILEEVKMAHEEMHDFAHLERGQLIVGTMTGTTWLPNFLATFLRRYPHVYLTMVERPSAQLLKLLENREIHVACVLAPTPDSSAPPGILVRPLFTRDLVVVVSPRHRLARRASVRLDELAGERLILTSPAEAPRVVVDRAFHAEGIEPVVWFEADDPATLVGLVAEGIAVGITGEAVARRNTERVVGLALDGPPLQYAMALAWSERGPHTRAMSTFLDFAASWLTSWGASTQTIAESRSVAAPRSEPAIR